mmetsp:Transcript_15370/g.34872  ORF Transcript_15370/g.34872 Transcript_15370/m.34872 type:complete len:228 (+) Transcript_15370:104-787(+)
MRCAIVIVVHLKSDRMACWIVASVSASRALVASSRRRRPPSGWRRNRARAKQSNWSSPTEKLPPPSSTLLSRPPASCTRFWSCDFSMASHRSASLFCPKGSRLKRMLPVRIAGSCGITAAFSRRLCKPMLEWSTPSMTTLPAWGSTIRIKANNMEDLPQPVLPTTPMRSPGLMGGSRVRPRKTNGVSGRYRNSRPSIATSPEAGQDAGSAGTRSGSVNGASSGTAVV